jgi:Ca2+/Na+ antiporter
MEKIKVIVTFIGMLALLVFILRKGRQIKEELKRAKIIEPDGSHRNPTMSERMAIAHYLANEKSEYFWPLILIFILLFIIIFAIAMILLMTGMLPKLIPAAAKIYIKYFLFS